MAKRFRITGLRVRERCEEIGLKPSDLALIALINPENARNLVYGKRSGGPLDPMLSTLIPVARALGTYVEDLLIPSPDEMFPIYASVRPPRSPMRLERPFVITSLRVKEFCEEQGWGSDDIARASGINFMTAINIYQGKVIDPRLGTIIPIAAALGKHVEELAIEDFTTSVLPRQPDQANA